MIQHHTLDTTLWEKDKMRHIHTYIHNAKASAFRNDHASHRSVISISNGIKICISKLHNRSLAISILFRLYAPLAALSRDPLWAIAAPPTPAVADDGGCGRPVHGLIPPIIALFVPTVPLLLLVFSSCDSSSLMMWRVTVSSSFVT